MGNSIISKVLYFVGIGTIIVGVAASLIIGGPINNIAIIIGGTMGSIISGIILIGFGEVISLLQQNVDNQNIIINHFNNKSSKINTNTTSKNVPTIKIEPNKTTYKRSFKCANCGKIIDQYPCPECGFKFN